MEQGISVNQTITVINRQSLRTEDEGTRLQRRLPGPA